MKKFFVLVICALCMCSAFAAGENVTTSKAFVDTVVALKQDKIQANAGTASVLTNTGVTGTVGTKGIYDSSAAYSAQADSLIDAQTMNAAVQNAINAEFKCVQTNPNDSNDCWLVDIFGATTAQQPYVSATGTAMQDGTPTPENPIEPVFYRQGDMVLRRVGDYADSYDATTDQITRRVGVLVLKGDEPVRLQSINSYNIANFYIAKPSDAVQTSDSLFSSSHFMRQRTLIAETTTPGMLDSSQIFYIRLYSNIIGTVNSFKQYLAEQFQAGSPVTIYYRLATPVVENWTETTYNQYMPSNN